MHIYVCGGKQTSGTVTNYLLRDIRNCREKVVTGEELKEAMRKNRVDVMNLTLTSDNRLVEASKEKMAQLRDMLKAPAEISSRLSPMPQAVADKMESVMDDILRHCIEEYVKEGSKYVKLGHFDKENNTCVLEFTLGLNSYVLLSYDKLCYGIMSRANDSTADSNRGCACLDIIIRVLGVSNKRARSKIGDGSALQASRSIEGPDSCLQFDYRIGNNGQVIIDDVDIDRLKRYLGSSLMVYVSQQLKDVCDRNPDIANNTHVKDYIAYDAAKKEYRSNLAVTAGTALGAAVIVGAIVAFAFATDPDIIQTGLLAKIADVGSPDQIMHAIAMYSGGIGLLAGGTAAAKIAVDSDLGTKTFRSSCDVHVAKKKIRGDWMGVFGNKR